jgi:hypothetical protein
MGKIYGETTVCSRNSGLKYRAEYNASNQVIYEGWSLDPNAAETDTTWQVVKHTWTSDNLTSSDWAKLSGRSTDDFVFAWSSHATYSY